MKSFISKILLLLLVACGPIYSYDYQYIPPASARGKECIRHCRGDSGNCAYSCQSTYNTCRSSQENQAYYRYQDYRASCKSNCNKTVNDFRNMSICDSDNNRCKEGCDNNYRQCYQDCGGEVLTIQKCELFCNQKH